MTTVTPALEGQDNLGYDVEGGVVMANGGAELERGEPPLRSVLATRSSSGSGPVSPRPQTPA